MKLSGKTAVVTGGGSGIGAAIATALAEQGARVVIAGRHEKKLREAADKFNGSPPIEFHEVDVADRASVTALFTWIAEKVGPVHMLVNAAGTNIKNRTLVEMRPEQWDELLAINATGAYNCMHAVLPQMRERHDGVIINISSTSGKRAWKLGGVAYSASKFALTALSTAAANEEGAHGIRVTAICPGEVDTPLMANRPTPPTPEHRARMLQPEDIAAAVLLVATLPPRAHVAEMIIKPTTQEFV
ncbi:MAG TPA: SDR family NAD(P)-dependent oxidoreductase [Pirellulales bacterium]|nr:SDR family NAD(P)-dependent oxidoreductase [Pirellulales bacterium]